MTAARSRLAAVGVDGGQSALRVRIAGEPREHSVPGVSWDDAEPGKAVVAALRHAWTTWPDLPVGRAVLGLTTAPSGDEARRAIAVDAAHVLGAREVWVTDDLVTAHAGAIPDGPGVVLAAGTGVACLAADPQRGELRVVDGSGYLLGDDGGGFWIGRAGLAAVVRHRDGRRPVMRRPPGSRPTRPRALVRQTSWRSRCTRHGGL